MIDDLFAQIIASAASGLVVPPPPSLADPTLVDFFATSSVSGTVQDITGITGLTPGAKLIAVCFTRRGNTSGTTHGTPTLTGINTVGGFTLVDADGIQQPSVSAFIQTTMWEAMLTASPGSGDIQNEITNALSNRALFVYEVVGAASGVLTQGAATATTGTGLAVPFDDSGTPPADSMSIGAYAQNGVGGAGLDASGTLLADASIEFGTNMETAISFKRLSPPNNVTWTGGETDKAKAGAAALIGQLT